MATCAPATESHEAYSDGLIREASVAYLIDMTAKGPSTYDIREII